MRVVPRHELARSLRLLGLCPETQTWTDADGVSRILVREHDPELVDKGPHRRIALPDEAAELKLRVGDRPRLGAFAADLLRQSGAAAVYATTPPGTYWLNNQGYADYLRRVPDAQTLSRFLRRIGLTDRFRGGFLIQRREFELVIPLLASQPFCGAPDVLFVAADRPMTVLACHEFDVHAEAKDGALISTATDLARKAGLEVVGVTSDGTREA